ncbi:chemotaxis protein MotB [Devosia sp. UYZn731]|uniref:OmpA/MotB family protein n=1 Tax=Devosia sp. UYZn731 TaxID=3156345 RepID=UPI003395F317
MAALKKRHPAGGAHGGTWIVSFADLMALLMAFFVMLLSFSTQEQEKLTQATGSLQHAFGITPDSLLAGVIERNGQPDRNFMKSVTQERTDATTEFSTVQANNLNARGEQTDTAIKEPNDVQRAANFSLAAASLKQAWQDQPDITALADNLIVEETQDGINIIIADQTGRAMFSPGSKYPNEMTRKALAAMAPALAKMPNQIAISGHTAAGGSFPNPNYGPWELSFDRANMVRQILGEFGVPDQRIADVSGRSDSDPFFTNDPYLPSNERVIIVLKYDAPPLPANMGF